MLEKLHKFIGINFELGSSLKGKYIQNSYNMKVFLFSINEKRRNSNRSKRRLQLIFIPTTTNIVGLYAVLYMSSYTYTLIYAVYVCIVVL